ESTDDAWISVRAYRRMRGRGVHFDGFGSKKDWPAFRPRFFEIVQNATAGFAWWPARPAGRELEVVDGIGYSKAPNVQPRDLKEIQKVVARMRKDVEAFHGPLWTPPDEPLAIYVNGTPAGHEAITGWNTGAAVTCGAQHNRIVTIPLGKR